MKVSVVIPAHNEEKYIARTVEAVLALDYPDFEVIVVDNASTDKTAEVAKSFPGVIVLREARKGTQFARECGRKVATGELIASIDADCLPPSDWLSKGVIHFERDGNVVSLSGPYDYYDAFFLFRYSALIFQKIFYTLIHNILSSFSKGGVFIAGNGLIRQSALEKMGGYDVRFIFYGDDTDTVKRLSKIGKTLFRADFVVKSSARRFKKEGMVKTFSKYTFHFFKVLVVKDVHKQHD